MVYLPHHHVLHLMQMVCNQPGVMLDDPSELLLDLLGGDSIRQPTATHQSPSLNAREPSFVFTLRCPYCPLITVRWQHFLLHPPNCPGQPQSGYKCRIYWCSDCQAVSTEQELVAEHAAHAHAAGVSRCVTVLHLPTTTTTVILFHQF